LPCCFMRVPEKSQFIEAPSSFGIDRSLLLKIALHPNPAAERERILDVSLRNGAVVLSLPKLVQKVKSLFPSGIAGCPRETDAVETHLAILGKLPTPLRLALLADPATQAETILLVLNRNVAMP